MEMKAVLMRSKPKRCKRCGKKWCGTTDKLVELDGNTWQGLVLFGSVKCRWKGPKR